MSDTPKIGTTRVTPVAYGPTGYSEVHESKAQFFSVTIYADEKGYGRGWFPLYGFQADAHNYMYKDKARAYAVAGLEMPKTPATKTVIVIAEMIQALVYKLQVPDNTTDEEIADLVADIDGSDFVEIGNGGSWSQSWSVE